MVFQRFLEQVCSCLGQHDGHGQSFIKALFAIRLHADSPSFYMHVSCRFLSRSSATIYSLTGSINKIIVAVLGILLFNESSNIQNLASIAVGLGASILFVMAKSAPQTQPKSPLTKAPPGAS